MINLEVIPAPSDASTVKENQLPKDVTKTNNSDNKKKDTEKAQKITNVNAWTKREQKGRNRTKTNRSTAKIKYSRNSKEMPEKTSFLKR